MGVAFPFNSAGYTAGHGWRPLRKKQPYQRGWDVYDLQCKLAYVGHEIDTDGVFGPQTDRVVREFQATQQLVVDGIAGAATQTNLGAWAAGFSQLPNRVRGQMEKESSLLCGIYTAQYSNGSRDRGPLQENSDVFTSDEAAFDVRRAIPDLVQRIREYHAKYVNWGLNYGKAWAAAQGAWNSPVYADRYARGQNVPQTFLDYIAAVTAYA